MRRVTPIETDLNSLALFVRIVEEGSLSAAGRSIGLPKATVSRRLTILETALGAALLTRSTRALSLTDAGRRLFDRVQPIVDDARAAQLEIAATTATPAGLLRITAPLVFGQTIVAPKLVQFLEQYPRVQAELHFTDKPVNLVAEGFDLAIRMGELPDSSLIGRRLAEVAEVIVAAPSYLAKHGYPAALQDLKRHFAVVTTKDQWIFNGEAVRIPWRMITGNLPITRDAVRAGLGIGLLPLFFVIQDLKDGSLIRLLPDVQIPKSFATALYPRSTVPSPALRALLVALSAAEDLARERFPS